MRFPSPRYSGRYPSLDLDDFAFSILKPLTDLGQQLLPFIVDGKDGDSCGHDADEAGTSLLSPHSQLSICVPRIATTTTSNPNGNSGNDLTWYMILVCCYGL